MGLELRGSSSQDTNLEVISTLAGGSSAHAWPSVGLQSGQASFRSLVLPGGWRAASTVGQVNTSGHKRA